MAPRCVAVAGEVVDNPYTRASSSTLDRVQWDRLFEDLEGQLAAEWEAERAVLDAESERLRIAKLELRTRLRVFEQADVPIGLRLCSGEQHRVRLRAVGADWIAAQADGPGALIVPLAAVSGIQVDHGALLDSLDENAPASDGLRTRMTLGFLLRDLARRRAPLQLALSDGEQLHGTVDRAGSDHLDLAVHDAGEPRRARAVRAFRLIPQQAIVWMRVAQPAV